MTDIPERGDGDRARTGLPLRQEWTAPAVEGAPDQGIGSETE